VEGGGQGEGEGEGQEGEQEGEGRHAHSLTDWQTGYILTDRLTDWIYPH